MDNFQIANPLKRLLAIVIDIFIIVPFYVLIIGILDKFLALPITHIFSISTGFTITLDEWAKQHILEIVLYYSLIKLITLFFYFSLFEASNWQGTFGKKIVNIRVSNLGGQRISYKTSVVRFLGRILSAQLLIGYIMIFFTKKKQGLHDILAKTLVIEIH